MKYSINKFEVNEQEILFDDSNFKKIEEKIGFDNYQIFSEIEKYNIGDVVQKDNHIYQFIKEHQGKWNNNDVQNWSIVQNEEYMYGKYELSPEFIQLFVDKNNKIICGVHEDGNIYFGAGIPKQIKSYIEKNTNNINDNILTLLNDELNLKVDKVEDKDLINKIFSDSISDDSNLEYSYLILDYNNKIIQSISKDDGVITHNTKTVFNDDITINGNIKMADKTLSNLQKSILSSVNNANDFSYYYSEDGDMPLNLSIPRCAKLNILNDTDLTKLSKLGLSSAQPGVNCEIITEVEFSDMSGNYFKKWVRMSGQGSSSMSLPKKSISLDFYESYDDAVNDDEKFTIKFGDWIPQDSFHMKAFYTDFFKGVSIVGYKLANQILTSRDITEDRPWKKALLSKYNYQSSVYNDSEYSDLNLQFDNGARCLPDAFPCIVYQRGEFYGIFSFALKKHRDNYHQEKDNAKHIHIDGAFFDRKNAEGVYEHHSIWMGIIDWSVFEIRNPKYLVYAKKQNGTYEYDADVIQAEIAGETDLVKATIYDSTKLYNEGDIVLCNDRMYMAVSETLNNNPENATYGSKPKNVFDKATDYWIDITFTNEVKQSIIKLSKRIPDCKSAQTIEQKRQIIDTYFDKDNLADWCNHTNFIYNIDSQQNNTQWVTYDGIKWFACIYDLDITFGINSSIGTTVAAPNDNNIVANDQYFPGSQAWTCYKDDIKARYKQCKELGIFTYENVSKMLIEWINRIGISNYVQEYAKWTEAPCNRDSTKNYNMYPQTGGHYDNLYRLLTWLKKRIEYVDNFMNV